LSAASETICRINGPRPSIGVQTLKRSIEAYIPHFAFPDVDAPVRAAEIIAHRSVALSGIDQIAEQSIFRQPPTTLAAAITRSVTQWFAGRFGTEGCINREAKIRHPYRERQQIYLPAISLSHIVVVTILSAIMTVYLISIFEFLEPAF
jgi:hypothetical protein